MALQTGAHLGPYEVVSLLGSGGMGEVYRAHDTKLNRDVAIKVLPDSLAADPDRLARFHREAQLLASLNHPNIAALYGFEDSGHIHALVMELVEGPTLAARIAQGPIPVAETLPIAKGIADALEAAHEHGIIHRDLKPANIKVRNDGMVKVLDFGLAKLVESNPASGVSATMSPTVSHQATLVGTILGTAAYMAPEQAKGLAADKRSDVWGFGCVLYEMLTGSRAFDADDVSETLAAVLRGEPDWAALPADTPAGLRKALFRCLEKNRKRRLRDMGDVGLLMDEIAEAPVAPAQPAAAGPGRRRERLMWAAFSGALLAALVGAAVLWYPRSAVAPRVTRFSVTAPQNFPLSTGTSQVGAVLSPDGQHLAFVGLRGGASVLLIRDLDAVEARPVPGTEGAIYPFWSPDSRTVGFFITGGLKTVNITGGLPHTVCAVFGQGRGGTWNREGTIVFAVTNSPSLLKVPAVGGKATSVTTVDTQRGEAIHRFPSFLPDGHRFFYWIWPLNQVRVGSLDSAAPIDLFPADAQVQYVEPGYVLLVRGGRLLAQPFDRETAKITGEAVPVVEEVFVDGNNYAAFSAADSGILAYRAGRLVEITQLTWFDRAGKILGTVGAPGAYRNPALSPDGSHLAIESLDAGRNRDIAIFDLARNVWSRFTFDLHNDIMPVWSPSGDRIVFGSDRDGGQFSIYEKPSNGATTEQILLKSTSAAPYSWSRNGKFILHRSMQNGFFNTGVLSVGDKNTRLFRQVEFNMSNTQVSPDGRWVAYQANEGGGAYQVIVETFPNPGGRFQISKDGGVFAKWSADGKELFYYAADGDLVAVPITSGQSLQMGQAHALFKARMLNGPTSAIGFRAQYDVALDGRRFLLNVPVEDAPTPSVTIVLNWLSGIRTGR